MPVDAMELAAEAVRACGGSRGALVKRLDLRSYGEDKVGRWLRGESKPRYDETIALLEVVGWLNTSGGRRKASAARSDPQAELAAAAVDLTKGQAQLLSELRALREELEASRGQRPARPRRKTSG